MTMYKYIRSTDGCDETFDVYRGDEHLVSIHFWDEEARAESTAQLIVAALTAYDPNVITANDTRAKRFSQVLRSYDTDDTNAACLTDLLTDARHWCDRHQVSFAGLDRLAYQHYLAELTDDESIEVEESA